MSKDNEIVVEYDLYDRGELHRYFLYGVGYFIMLRIEYGFPYILSAGDILVWLYTEGHIDLDLILEAGIGELMVGEWGDFLSSIYIETTHPDSALSSSEKQDLKVLMESIKTKLRKAYHLKERQE